MTYDVLHRPNRSAAREGSTQTTPKRHRFYGALRGIECAERGGAEREPGRTSTDPAAQARPTLRWCNRGLERPTARCHRQRQSDRPPQPPGIAEVDGRAIMQRIITPKARLLAPIARPAMMMHTVIAVAMLMDMRMQMNMRPNIVTLRLCHRRMRRPERRTTKNSSKVKVVDCLNMISVFPGSQG